MSALQEQAIRMIGGLSDDNVGFLIELMQKFMMPKGTEKISAQANDSVDTRNFMQDMETMRMRAKSYFSADFDPTNVWEEAMNEKYGSFD